MVYVRTLGPTTLRFQVSGMLWRNSLIMVDRETGTWWSHVTGKALRGALDGRRLEIVPSAQTTWREWRRAHPETDVLVKTEEIRDSHYRRYFDGPERTGLFRSRWLAERMPGKTLVWGARLGLHAAAITDGAVEGRGIAAFELGGQPVVALLGPGGGVRAFVARIGDEVVAIERRVDGRLVDRATGSTWDAVTGEATTGAMAGSRLDPVAVTRAYWFAWSSFFPSTLVIESR